MTHLEMINEFQCPGCIFGINTSDCPQFELDKDPLVCKNHHPATYMSGAGKIAIGLPKGFNRPGNIDWSAKSVYWVRLGSENVYNHRRSVAYVELHELGICVWGNEPLVDLCNTLKTEQNLPAIYAQKVENFKERIMHLLKPLDYKSFLMLINKTYNNGFRDGVDDIKFKLNALIRVD